MSIPWEEFYKSAPDPEVGVQLLGYLAEIWRRLDRQRLEQRELAVHDGGDVPDGEPVGRLTPPRPSPAPPLSR